MAVAGPKKKPEQSLVFVGGRHYWYSETGSPSFVEVDPNDLLRPRHFFGPPSVPGVCINYPEITYPTDYPFSQPFFVDCAYCRRRYDVVQHKACPGCGAPLLTP